MLINKLDEGIVRRFWRERKERPKKSHHASELSYKTETEIVGACIRKQFYDWIKQKPSDVNPTRLYFAEVGRLLHKNLFKSLWEEAEVLIYEELPLSVDVKGLKDIHGYVDDIMKIDKKVIMAEIKTTQGKGMTSKGFGIKYCGAKLTDELQLLYYKDHYTPDDKVKALGKITEYWILYFARDSFYRMELPLDLDGVNWNKCYDRWHDLEGFLKIGTPPPRDFKAGTYPCTWCVYETYCWSRRA